MNIREIHIGQLVEERIKEMGITKAEFGRRISTSRQNVNTILKKKSLDSEMLGNISEVLNFDFFTYYGPDCVKKRKNKESNEQPKGL